MARVFRRKQSLDAISEINVTPLIDLAFALLIIFMIAAPLLESSIQINLPQQSESTDDRQPEPEINTINIDSQGRLFWGDQQVTLVELDRVIANAASAEVQPVLNIRADRNLRYQEVISVLDIAKKHKISKLSLGTLER